MYEREYRKEQKCRKRELQLRRRLRILKISVSTASLVLLLSLTLAGFSSYAQSDTAQHAYKYYTSVLIHGGDTLWDIAENYKGSQYASTQKYIQEVMQINHLNSTDLKAGEYLIVPYYSSEFF